NQNKCHKRKRMVPEQSYKLDGQTHKQKRGGQSQIAFNFAFRFYHCFDGLQNFRSFRCPTSWKWSWQPLVRQEVWFDLIAAMIAGSALCTAPSSKLRAPS